MKNRKLTIIALLLAFSLLLSACSFGEYNGITRPTGGTIPPVTNSQGQVDDNPFTVSLTIGGELYVPSIPISVQWNDGYSLYTAPIGTDGVARYGFLDGDYHVTLTDVPEGYAYNPNAYIASNSDRNIEIELIKLSEGKGKGVDPYSPIKTSSVGIYCVEIKNEKDEVFFQFAPTAAGKYQVESWTDVTADEVNPIANYYGANPMFADRLVSSHNVGGVEGSYTKNFLTEVEIAEHSVSSSGGGAAGFTFGFKATHKDGKYPIKLYIAIGRDGDYFEPQTEATIIAPSEVLSEAPDMNGEFINAETLLVQGGGSTWVFDADNYKYWSREDGGDGYYHVYDPAAYPETFGFGPVLYAKITEGIDFINDMSFNLIEYEGNKALTIGDINYKMFIEGWDTLNYTNMVIPGIGTAPYFCDLFCPCRLNKTCTSDEMGLATGTCETGCPDCGPGCRNLPRELIGAKGYADFVNSDGCYPVTQELKEFLQAFSISQLLFMDGEGYAETLETRPVFATEDDQWLFACGYYKEK